MDQYFIEFIDGAVNRRFMRPPRGRQDPEVARWRAATGDETIGAKLDQTLLERDDRAQIDSII